MSRTGSLLFRNCPRVAWLAAAQVERRRQRRQWCASALLGAMAVLGSGIPAPAVPGPTMPGMTGPVDGTVVSIPPVYPGSPPGFLRLPETHSAPVGPTVAPGFAGRDDRLLWSPARLDPVVGVDARGHVTSILEYTPGRFER